MPASDDFRAIVSGQRRGPLASMVRSTLRLAEPVYRAAVSARNLRFDHGYSTVHRLPIPVISVGNLTLGGTGKTPMVAWLAQWFVSRGIRVGLVSRGYQSSQGQANDEAKELARRLPNVPHIQNPNRVAAGHEIVQRHQVQLLVLDDAFQHRRVARDLDIVLVDATNPFGFDHVFPRGMLREPKTSLRRADVVALTRSNLVSESERRQIEQMVNDLAPNALWLEVEQHPGSVIDAAGDCIPADQVPRGDVLAFCGIGNPAGFRQLLDTWLARESVGQLRELRAFPDHYAYPTRAIEQLQQWAASAVPQTGSVFCTAKDMVKLTRDRLPHGRLSQLPLFALQMELTFRTGRPALETVLQSLAGRAGGPVNG